MAIIELDLDALTAREIAERLAGTLKCGKARQVATLLDIAARERESERRRPEREARQRQRDQERLPSLQQEAVSQLRLLPFTAADGSHSFFTGRRRRTGIPMPAAMTG